MSKEKRPAVPDSLFNAMQAIMSTLPEAHPEDAWVGVRWRVGAATVAHLFGGEDQRFRVVMHGQPADAAAFEHLGEPYFTTNWGINSIGLILDEHTDWEEVRELLIESYCIQAPKRLVDTLDLPPGADD